MPSQAEVEALIWSVRVEVARAERLQVEVCWAIDRLHQAMNEAVMIRLQRSEERDKAPG